MEFFLLNNASLFLLRLPRVEFLFFAVLHQTKWSSRREPQLFSYFSTNFSACCDFEMNSVGELLGEKLFEGMKIFSASIYETRLKIMEINFTAVKIKKKTRGQVSTCWQIQSAMFISNTLKQISNYRPVVFQNNLRKSRVLSCCENPARWEVISEARLRIKILFIFLRFRFLWSADTSTNIKSVIQLPEFLCNQ